MKGFIIYATNITHVGCLLCTVNKGWPMVSIAKSQGI